jgi:redox-sensitive bicupin YhaK (pirin superfamily)
VTPDLLPGHPVALGGTRGFAVTRTLPHRERRTVGAWCFADSYGPHDVRDARMRVPAHPHIGLQTVSWLLAGEIEHRDSLGSRQLVRPGELNLMTAGRGIAHSEVTPADASGHLHGVQLWVALPAGARDVAPAFAHHADLPTVRLPGATAVVILGRFAGQESPAVAYTPIVGAQVTVSGRAELPLEPGFEHAVLGLDGALTVAGTPLPTDGLVYLADGTSAVTVSGTGRLLLIGGEPFDEELVMWWNFVGRSHEEIAAARADWTAGARFGSVPGPEGTPLPAPELPGVRLRPRPRVRT